MSLSTQDYRKAVANEGPHALNWSDKPHRLIYDLCSEVEQLREALKPFRVLKKRITFLERENAKLRQRIEATK